ncbi:MFS transporter [Bradyrhizobium sp. 2TAF24]|uniref:MFS transporter n=1 Tax=Bradyrhizobium sp. 2TAF24 TaxID=3233011 RepID=UPI003F909082
MRHDHVSISRLFAILVPGGLLALLSSTVTGVALPHILADLGDDIASGQWITTAYLLAAGLAIPVASWAGTRFGLRSTWLTAMLLFALGALAGLFARDIWSLTAARALQGFGGGALEPLMVTTLAAATPPERMGRTMGAMAVVMEIGPLLGPTLGGAAVDVAGWRSIYVGFALASAVMLTAGAFVLRRGERHAAPLDGIGLAIVSMALIAGLWGLARAATPAGFDMPTLAALIFAGAAFLGFVQHSRRLGARSILNLETFARPGFTVGIAIMALLGATIFPLFFSLPQFYQGVCRLSPLAAGMLMIPYGVGTLATMPLMGHLSDRVATQRIVGSGAALSLLAFTALFLAGSTLSVAGLGVLSLVTGIGLGAIASPTVSAVYRVLPPALTASGSTILFIVLQLGGAFGVALLVLLIGHGAWTAAVGTWPFLLPIATALVIAIMSVRLPSTNAMMLTVQDARPS